MKCSEAQKRIRPYLEHTLQERDMAAFLDHIESCPECREELELSLAVYGTGKYQEEWKKKLGDNFPARISKMMEQDRKRLKHIRTEHITSVTILLGALVLLGFVLYFSIFGMPWALKEPEAGADVEAVTETVSESLSETVSEAFSETASEVATQETVGEDS